MRALICEHHRYDASLRLGSHQVAAVLARRGWDVTWLSHPRSFLHYFTESVPPRRQVHGDGTVELSLRTPVPYIGQWVLGSLTWGRHWLNLPGNRRLLQEAAGSTGWDLIWLSDFTVLPVLDWVPARRVVLRHFDLLEHFAGTPHSIFRLIRQYRGRADLEVASSAAVQEALAHRGIHTELLPNGVDLSSFPRELALREERRDEVIYVGALREWIDFNAIATFARRLPQVTFRLVGPDDQGRAAGLATALDNVLAHGTVDHSDLADLLSRARFGLVPFRPTKLAQGVDPLKMQEYLASGLPVLASDLPSIEPRSEGVFLYRDADEGAELLAQHLHDSFDRAALRGFAEENGWQDRIEAILGRLGF